MGSVGQSAVSPATRRDATRRDGRDAMQCRLTLQRALVAPELPGEVRVLATRLLRVLSGDGTLGAGIGAGVGEHGACVGLGGFGDVGVSEGGAVAAEDAVVMLLEGRGAVGGLVECGEGAFGGLFCFWRCVWVYVRDTRQ